MARSPLHCKLIKALYTCERAGRRRKIDEGATETQRLGGGGRAALAGPCFLQDIRLSLLPELGPSATRQTLPSHH